MTTIYLAGKMGSRWGQCDCGAERCHPHCEPDHGHKCGSEYRELNWRHDLLRVVPSMNERVAFARGYSFGGPWFVDNHNHDMDAEHIADRCMEWIKRSDAVFAWISSLDAHGTFAEMGYAAALRKPVFAAFDRDSVDPGDERELWFIRQLADGRCSVRGVRTAFAIFTHWLAAPQAPAYGPRW